MCLHALMRHGGATFRSPVRRQVSPPSLNAPLHSLVMRGCVAQHRKKGG